ncbi:MAG: protease pro-enzyme activation domain-containing protein [Polyangiaceae bacterium]
MAIGANSQIVSLLAAPNGTVSFGNYAQATGAYAGLNCTAGSSVVLNFQSGFANSTPSFSTFVAYAELSMTLGAGDHAVGGDIGVAAIGASSVGTQLTIGSQDVLDPLHTVYAPSVLIGSQAVVGDIDANNLSNSGGLYGTLEPYPASAMPLLPLALASTPNTTNVTVAQGHQQTLSPGSFGTLTDNGIVFLNPGTYSFSSVTLGSNAQLQALQGGPTSVLVAGNLSTGTFAQIFPVGQAAGNLTISVAGSDGTNASPPAVSIGASTQLVTLLNVPHGTLSFANNVQATGAFAGFSISVGNNVLLQFQSGFSPSPQGQPLSSYTLPPSAPIVGPLPDSATVALAVVLPVRNLPGLQAFIQEVTSPTSPMYRNYISPATFGATYGVLPTEYSKVAPWAQGYGMSTTTYPNNLLVDVAGTAAQAELALNVNFVLALRPDGTQFYEPDRQPTPSLPTSVDAIQGIDNYTLPRYMNQGTGPVGYWASSDLRTAYLGTGTSCSSLTGAGQQIGLVEFDGFTQPSATGSGDIGVYEMQTGLASPTGVSSVPAPMLVPVNAGVTGQPSGGLGSQECALDVEMAIAMAPGAQVIVFEGTLMDSILSAMASTPNLNQISNSQLVPVGTTQRWIYEFSAQGQSFFVSSDDSGAYAQASASCTCNCTTAGGQASIETVASCPGTCPAEGTTCSPGLVCAASGSVPALDVSPTDTRSLDNVTLVGGTTLTTCEGNTSGVCAGVNGGTETWASESPWAGSGGGLIAVTPLPDFQQHVTTLVSNAGRNSPDVAIVAQQLYFVATACNVALVNGVCPQGQLLASQPQFSGGATSAAAPLWAGFMALMNEQGGMATPPLPSIGFPNELFYDILSLPVYGQAFHDIQGLPTNQNECGLGFTAGPGWDGVTGLGTPQCGLINAAQAAASPPQAIVTIEGLQFNTTGFNICTACSGPQCFTNLANTTVTVPCTPPAVNPDGSVQSKTVTEEVGCSGSGSGNHGALVSVTCAPSTTFPADAGNGSASRGIDVTVSLSLEETCGDNTPVDSDPATFTDVLPGQPQPAGPQFLQACDFFGGDTGLCSIFANGGKCTFNGFSGSVSSVTNTGGFFPQSP